MQKTPTHFKLPVLFTAALMVLVLLWSCNNSADSSAAMEASKADSSAAVKADSSTLTKPDSTAVAPKTTDTLPPIDTSASTRPPDPGTKKTK